jgi:hypothetical protein
LSVRHSIQSQMWYSISGSVLAVTGTTYNGRTAAIALYLRIVQSAGGFQSPLPVGLWCAEPPVLDRDAALRGLPDAAGSPAEPVLAAWGITTGGKPAFIGLAPGSRESSARSSALGAGEPAGLVDGKSDRSVQQRDYSPRRHDRHRLGDPRHQSPAKTVICRGRRLEVVAWCGPAYPQAHKSGGLLAWPCGQLAAGFGYRHVRPVSGEMELPHGMEATMIEAMAAARRRWTRAIPMAARSSTYRFGRSDERRIVRLPVPQH